MRPPLPQPDFLHPVRAASRLPWLWCATGLLVLAVAGLEAADDWQRRQDALDRLEQVAQAPRAPRNAAPARPADADSQRRDAEAARWLQRLALPWPQVFAAAETAAVPGVFFTGLAFDGQGLLRLEGQASDPAAALAAAQALRSGDDAARAPWHSVTLSRLDSLPAGQRLEILAQWAAPAVAR